MVNRLVQRSAWFFALVAVMVVGGMLLGSSPAQAQLANTPWPKFGQDVRNTGQSPFGGVGASWQSAIGSAQAGPAIASDGTIYVGASSSFGSDSLYAINPEDGSVEWFFAPGDFSVRSIQPVIGGDGTIYIGGRSSDGGLLYAVRPDGSRKWEFFASETIRTTPVIGSDGTVYAISSDFESGTFHALNPSSGQPIWTVNIGSVDAAPTIASNGTIYVGDGDGTIYAVDPAAEEAVPLETTLSGGISGIAIGSGGILYVTYGSNQLAAIDPSSDTLLWSASADLFSITAPALGPNGRIFFGVGGEVDGAIYAFDTNGNELWSVATNGLIEAPPAVGNDGRLYVGIDDFTASDLVALDPADGSLIWAFGAGGSLNYPLALAADGTVYAGTGNGLASVIGPEIALSPPTLDFGTVGVGFSTTQQGLIENTGDAELEIASVSISGPDASAFVIESGSGSGTLAPGATRTVTVAFSPSSAGDKSATLTATSTTGSASSSLIGTGVDAPSATTNPATDVGATSATFNGFVNPNGAETTVIFEYGLTTEYGSTASAVQSPLAASTGSQAVSAAITDLEPGTTYHYRVVASNTAGETAGGDQTFTTGAAAPVALTEAATEIGGRTATLNGIVNPGGTETAVTFEYGLTPEYGTTVTAEGSPFSGTSDRSVSASVAELQANTTYHYRVVASNSAGEDAGEDRTFTTGAAAPLAATDPASEVTANGAMLNGTVAPGGLETTVTFEYGLTPEYGNTATAEQSPLSGTGDQAVSAAVAELASGTTYHYRVVASNSAGETAGDDQTFTTAATAPTVTTDPASEVGTTGAILNGTVNANGAATAVTFEYGLTTEYGSTITAEQSPVSGTTEQGVSAVLAELAPGTTYHYRVVASNEAGEVVGKDRTFTTEVAPPSAATNPASALSESGATLNGTVNPNGAETVVTFEYGLTPEYGTTATADQSPLSGTSDQAVSAAITGLDPGATYHYRVVASNSAGETAGEDQTFTTRAPVLSVTPSALSFDRLSVEDTSATQQVEIENSGDADLVIGAVALSSTEHFLIGSDTEESTLAPGAVRTVELAFAPTSGGTHDATLDIESNAGNAAVDLSGRGVAVDVSPPSQTIDVTGEPEEITVTASEGFEVQSGFLYFRRGGEQTYDRVPLTPESANQFTGALPGSVITERGVDLYAELTDGVLTATSPAQNPAGNPLHLRTQTASLPAEGAFTAETYRMISMPVVPGAETTLSVLDEYGAYEPQRWRLLRWDPEAGEGGSYRELEASQDFPALETPLAPGAAFWLITRDGESFSVENAQSTDGSAPFSIQLRPGFNQIANPFAYPVSWAQVEAPSGVDAPQEAFPPHSTVSVLEPWQGYWIFNRNSTPVQITVPPVEAGADVLAAAKQTEAAGLPFEARPEYTLQLSARLDVEGEAPMLRDRHNYVGWSARATQHFGAEDVPEVPPIGSHVRLSIVEDGTPLAGSLRPSDAEGYTWDLQVSAEVEEPFFRRKTVTVHLHDHGTRPADYQLQLIDRDHDRTRPITNSQFAVTLTPDHPTRHLRLVMGSPAFTEQEAAGVVPRTTALGAGYPNPAREAVSFEYQLSEEQRVVIAVYDVLGRRMQTLIDRQQPAGNHSVRWDGRQSNGAQAASGVYIVRMQAGSFSATRRIVLVR